MSRSFHWCGETEHRQWRSVNAWAACVGEGGFFHDPWWMHDSKRHKWVALSIDVWWPLLSTSRLSRAIHHSTCKALLNNALWQKRGKVLSGTALHPWRADSRCCYVIYLTSSRARVLHTSQEISAHQPTFTFCHSHFILAEHHYGGLLGGGSCLYLCGWSSTSGSVRVCRRWQPTQTAFSFLTSVPRHWAAETFW